MELPLALRRVVDTALAGIPLAALAGASQALSQRYRGEVRDGRLHLNDDLTARAYLATRLPATYAALRASLDSVAELRPEFAPASLLDFGAGPGTALWAAQDRWPSLNDAALIEASPAIRGLGEILAAECAVEHIAWSSALGAGERRDLVTLAYVLDELDPASCDDLVDRLWSLTGDTLLILEPGTPAGWRRILGARRRLLEAGAHLIAPCPHEYACPRTAPDWCHFSRRVARARLHRQAKGGEVPWEDEKYIYLAVSRHSGPRARARVIAPAQKGSGKTELKLCLETGEAKPRLFTRRDGEAFKAARRADWGDAV
jgi:ribosomal protein RSM22 (predicted rRNA methylase)